MTRTSSPLLALFALLSCAALVATAAPSTHAATVADHSDMALYKRRFGQENPAVLNDIRALGRLPGVPPNGRFDQIAGGFISTLLAATDPCARYPLIDEIITLCTQFNCLQQAVPVAQKLAALEKNFNPFLAGAAPNFCTDAAQPKSQQVRCIVPVIDPAAGGKGGLSSAEFNGKANAQLASVSGGKLAAASCAGKSVQQQAIALGLKDCVGCGGAAAAGGNAGANNGNAGNNGNNNAGNNNNGNNNNNNNNAGGNAAAGGGNLQTFTGALGGKAAPPVKNVGGARPFQVLVNGALNGDFLNLGAALGRSCDVQKNQCADVANSGAGRAQGLSVNQCDTQANACRAAINGANAGAAAGNANAGNNNNNAGNANAGNNGNAGKTNLGGGANLQTFTGALGGKTAPQVNNVGGARPFQVIVNGALNGDFLNLDAALGRSCDVQKNQCADVANSGAGRAQGLSVNQCDTQANACRANIANAGNGANNGANNGNAGNANGGKQQVDPNAGKAAGGAAAAEPPNTKPTGLRNDAQFCSQVGLGGALHDGTQKKTVTCSTTVQGTIPAFENMVSSIILSPASGATIKASSDVTVAVRTQGMNLGFFEDPNTRYYTSPQTLDKQGNIEGHQHVTVQALGNAQAPPNPQTQALAFFKGLDQATNNGILSVTIPAGTLQPGLTRICTMTGTRGHQAVLMPVARRGAQDDCIRVTVV